MRGDVYECQAVWCEQREVGAWVGVARGLDSVLRHAICVMRPVLIEQKGGLGIKEFEQGAKGASVPPRG
jgi:hypothetical protein